MDLSAIPRGRLYRLCAERCAVGRGRAHASCLGASHACLSAPRHEVAGTACAQHGRDASAAGTSGNFTETSIGFVPSQHLAPLADRAPDPVAVAEALVGTPYLWGGNSSFGIDCSGLVQIALRACGADCPGDSDLQEAVFASLAAPDYRRRGDLLFWKGHVGWIAGPDLLLHANAYHMAVAYEDLDTAIRRITAQGDGPVTSHVRPNTPEAP